MMSNLVLQIKNLSHTYNGTDLSLNKINLEIKEGEKVSILGNSGSGKSTLLRLIAGFESPQSGKIFINGLEVSSKTSFLLPEKRNLGLVVQEKALFPHMTIYQNICFGIRRVPEKEKIVNELLDLFKIDKLRDKYPHQISGGEQQRVAFARSMAPEPSFLMLDEAFSALDLTLKKSLYREISDIFTSKKSTVLLVTHDPEEASELTDRQLTMNNGQLI